MKKIIFILIVATQLIVVACQNNSKYSNETTDEVATEAQTSEFKNVDLKVVGMTCTGCEKTIEAGLSQMVGIKMVKASFTDSLVKIQLDESKVNVNQIKDKIADIGYTVE